MVFNNLNKERIFMNISNVLTLESRSFLAMVLPAVVTEICNNLMLPHAEMSCFLELNLYLMFQF